MRPEHTRLLLCGLNTPDFSMGQPSFISSSYAFGAPQHRALVSAMSCFSSELPPAKRGTEMRISVPMRISEPPFARLLHVNLKKKNAKMMSPLQI